MRKSFKKALSFVLSAAMLVSLGSGLDISTASVAATENGTGTETAATASGGAFKARVGFQMDNWSCRDEFADDKNYSEKKYIEWAKENNVALEDYNGCNIYLGGKVVAYNQKKNKWDNKPEDAKIMKGAKVTDVKMTEDGQYTIGIKDLDVNQGKDEIKNMATATAFNMLYVATNIPFADSANVKVKASSVMVAGKEVGKDVVLPIKGKTQDGQYCQFMFANKYTSDDGTEGVAYPENDKKLTDLVAPDGKFDIEITFSIEGVDWSKAPATDDEPEPSVAPTTQAPEVTPPPEVALKTSFDICVASNMNTALNPEEGARVKADGTTKVLAATYGSEAMKAKVVAAKGANGKPIYDEAEQDYIVENNASATISKTGTYTLSLTARGNAEDLTKDGAIWLPLIINGSTGTMPTDFNLVGKSVTVGEGDTAKTYRWPSYLAKDSSGDVRLTVYNKYETDPVKKDNANAILDTISVQKGQKISFTFYVTGDAPAPAKTATPEAIGASTSYMSYLGFQTDDWMFRDTWQSDTGLKCKDYNYKKQVAWSHDGKTNAVNVTSITDAKMTKNNVKYKVAIDGLNIKKTSKKSTQFNMLYLSTDIPLSMKGVSVKNAVLKIDGKTVKNYKVVPNKGDASKYYQFMLADAYAPSDGTKNAAYPDGKTLKKLPTKSIEVEYTVSGVDFNSRVVSVGNFKYKLTKNKAQVVGLSKKGKKKANLSLGKTIKVKAASPSAISSAPAVQTYKITSVKAGAFKNSSKLKKFSFKKATNIKALPSKAFMNCKKLKTVELNKKMKKIPAQAFKGCKKLTTIKCNAKLKSVSKSAFKGCKKKIKVTGKSKKGNKKKIKKAYKKVK